MNPKLLKSALLLSTATLLLSGCLGPAPDSAAAERHRQEAEVLAISRDFSGAAESLARAIEADPEATPLYLRRGEFLEGLGRWEEARQVYKSGLKKSRRPAPLEKELAWRLALLEALHLNEPGRAGKLLRQLGADGPLREDLQGVLAFKAGDLRKAIGHFDAALKLQPAQELTAAIYYHASRTYLALGDSRNTYTALFHAVNNASHRGTIREIETLWEILNASPEPEESQGR